MAELLINSTETLKTLLGGIQKKSAWPTWMPFVRQATYDHILPAIGEELLDFLCNQLGPDDTLQGSAKEKRLLEFVRIALGHYVEMDSELSILLQKGDGGISVASPPNQQAPGKWAIVARIKEARDKADRSIERVLQYLETNASDFPTWKQSTAYTVDHSLFLASATEYTASFGAVQRSRRLYVALRPYVVQAEKKAVLPVVGKAFFLHLKAKLLDSQADYSEEELEVLAMIRLIVANDAFARSLPYVNINVDGRLVSETDGINNEDTLPKDRRSEMRTDCEATADNEAVKLKKYLDANASPTVLTVYYTSPAYVVSDRKPYRLPQNDDKQKPFVL